MIKPIDYKIYWILQNVFIDYWLKGKIFDDQRFFGTPIQTLLDVKSVWLAVTIFNQIVSWRFDWSLPHQANNRFRGREVKGSSIGTLTDRSLVQMQRHIMYSFLVRSLLQYHKMQVWNVAYTFALIAVYFDFDDNGWLWSISWHLDL